MLSQTLQISFAKQQQLVSDDNNIVVNLFAIYVVSAEFSEGTLKSLNQSSTSHSQFEIKLRTTVPVAIALDISSAIILSPTETNLINNNGYDFFESIVIVENSKNYFDGDCLIATQTRCWQEFSIIIETNDCPTDSGLKFNGDYIFSSDFTCRDVENENTNSACNSYVNNSNPLPITMDSVDFSYTEACDAIIYQLDLSGDIDFYDDSSFSNDQTEFSAGDTVYTQVSVYGDMFEYEIFTPSIRQCFFCTSNSSDSLNGCWNSSSVNSGDIYSIQNDGLDYYTWTDYDTNSIVHFSFTLPFSAIGNVGKNFYVDCTLELSLGSNLTTQGSPRRALQSVKYSNTLLNTVGVGSYVDGDNDDHDKTSNDFFNPKTRKFWYGLSCILISILAVVCAACIIQKVKASRGKQSGEAAVEIVDSK